MNGSGTFSANRDDANASHLCIEAIELIYTLGLKPTPPLYEAFYAYAAQTNLTITPIISEALNEGRRLSDAEVQRLQQYCCGASNQDEQLHDLTWRLNEGVSEATSILEHAVETTSSYCNSLEGTQQDLTELRDPDKLAAVVAGLVKTTQEMQEQGSGVQKRLSEITCEIELVKHDLDTVRVQSHVDALTNTANRRMFDRAIAAVVASAEASGQPFCLCMVDADHFKSFNDAHGHQAGDSVLKLIASVLKNAVRDRDFVARYGGEEFALLLNGADLETGVTVAERIRSNLASKNLVSRGSGEHLGSITVSIGVAQYACGETISSLLQRADNCLYQAKREGRNRVVSETEMNPAAGGARSRAAGLARVHAGGEPQRGLSFCD